MYNPCVWHRTNNKQEHVREREEEMTTDKETQEFLDSLSSNTVRGWFEEDRKNHPIRTWFDSLFPDGGLLGYAPHYSLTHPFVLLSDSLYQIKWAWQRVFRGWDDRVIWSINFHLAEVLPQWLEKLKKYKHGIPGQMFTEEDYKKDGYTLKNKAMEKREKEYDAILDKIILGFNSYTKMDELVEYKSEEYFKLEKQFNEGFELLIEWFSSLWD